MVNLSSTGKGIIDLGSGKGLGISGSGCQDFICMLFKGTCVVPEILISNNSNQESLFSHSHRISGRHHRRCHRRR